MLAFIAEDPSHKVDCAQDGFSGSDTSVWTEEPFGRMKLFTHNMLMCHAKGCDAKGFPLKIEDAETETRPTEFNADFLRRQAKMLDWGALVKAARCVRCLYC